MKTEQPQRFGESTASEADLTLRRLINESAEEHFEDGVDSQFADALATAVNQYGNYTIRAARRLTERGVMKGEVLAEGLLAFGRLQSPATHDARFEFLVSALSDPASSIRTAAVLGLASLADTRALTPLGDALAAEQIPMLRNTLESVITGIEASKIDTVA